MNRSEHLQWCKNRAMEYLGNGDPKNAIASFMSDMGKHPETENHKALEMMTMMMFGGLLNTTPEVEKCILGFN